ncbi:MAG: kelch repeat-containing protein [Planctomycetota bacterium]
MTHLLTRVVAAALAVSPAFAQWVQAAPANHPTARRSSAMAFVPQNAGLILFGGVSPALSNQTWLYDGLDWSLLSPAVSPTARFGAELVYDQLRGVAVLYGGLNSPISIPPPTSETWEWDGTNWAQRTTTGNPGPRYLYGACFDLLRGRTVIYGGATSQLLGSQTNQTWEFDGGAWTQVATAGNPGPLERPAMCFDLGLGKAVLFGGGNGSGVSDQTWLYDGLAGTWTQVATSGPRPSPRNAARMVYDETHGVCVLHGGQDANGLLSDTWTFDGVGWRQQTGNAPTVRDHAMAFLPTVGQTVSFGGFVAAPNTLSDQTWELGVASYGRGCAGSNGTPTLDAAGASVIGQSFTLTVGNIEPNFNLAFVVLGLDKVASLDLGFLGMPGCVALATPDMLLNMAGAGGQATWTWPNVAGVLGATLYCQALCFDPVANAFGFTTSNGVFATLRN